jgi:hypothetical protein
MRAMIAAASDLVQGSEPSLVVRVLIVILICTLIAVLCGRMQQQWQQRQLRHAALALLKLHSQTATQSLNAASPLADRQTSHSITQRALASAIAELKAAAAAEDATAEDVGQQHAEERTYSELNDVAAATPAVREATQDEELRELIAPEDTGLGASDPTLLRTEMPDWLKRAESSVLDIHEHETISPPPSPRDHGSDAFNASASDGSATYTGGGYDSEDEPSWLAQASVTLGDLGRWARRTWSVTSRPSTRQEEAEEEDAEKEKPAQVKQAEPEREDQQQQQRRRRQRQEDQEEEEEAETGRLGQRALAPPTPPPRRRAASNGDATLIVGAALPKQVERSASGDTVRMVPPPEVYVKLQRARISRRQQSLTGSAHSPRSSHPATVEQATDDGDGSSDPSQTGSSPGSPAEAVSEALARVLQQRQSDSQPRVLPLRLSDPDNTDDETGRHPAPGFPRSFSPPRSPFAKSSPPSSAALLQGKMVAIHAADVAGSGVVPPARSGTASPSAALLHGTMVAHVLGHHADSSGHSGVAARRRAVVHSAGSCEAPPLGLRV